MLHATDPLLHKTPSKRILCYFIRNFFTANQQTIAREAHDKDYKIIIVSDACGAVSSELHENTLKSLQRLAQVVKSTELNDQLLLRPQ